MNALEFINLAIESSDKYFSYLDQNNKGLAIANVIRKEKVDKLIILKISRKIFSLDCIFLQINLEKVSKGKVKFVEYNEDSRTISLRAVKDIEEKILETKNEDLKIISDLKFLVKNVRDWYSRKENKIYFPDKKPNLTNIPAPKNASLEQLNAIKAIATQPFTYVWGAPGTGKTQFVLAQIVKQYIQENKKIIIVAPTNNAIEQVLRGVIKILDENEINRSNILRLGMPSTAFKTFYPEVCENSKWEKIVKTKQKEYDNLEEVITFKEKEENLEHLNKKVLPLLGKLVGFKYGKKNIYPNQIKMLESYIEQIPQLYKRFPDINIEKIYIIFKSAQSLRSELSKDIEEERWKFTDFENLSIKEIKDKQFESQENTQIDSNSTKERISNVNVIACTIDTFISKLTVNSKDKEIGKGKYLINPSHIFMDEAGYANIIKSMTLLTANCPVTLLGDHMQLPPVSEAKDTEVFKGTQRALVLWSQSAIYMGDIFIKSFAEIQSDYFNHNSPQFVNMKKLDLTRSYRFSNKLATILDKMVYKNGFGSNDNKSDFKISILNCKPSYSENKRENLSEVKSIISFINDEISQDLAVLSPYVNQAKLLGKGLPEMYRDSRILTVHASQGQEWDTVILSVSDSKNKWFTDTLSNFSGGVYVINTAVSRAKKHLVIACDVEHWKSQRGQLITEFISCADNIINIDNDIIIDFQEEKDDVIKKEDIFNFDNLPELETADLSDIYYNFNS